MKIFVEDISIEILESKSAYKMTKNTLVLKKCTAKQLVAIYQDIRDKKVRIKKVICLSAEPKRLFKGFQRYFKLIEAAGGIVEKKERVLFIFRLGKWDLPKGKVEKGETIETAAQREVEEECGIKTKLKKKIGETWHTYQFKGKDVLKCTHWFRMKNQDDSKIKPQTEEDIQKVCWIKKSKVKGKALKNTYKSILEIYKKYED